MVLAALSVAAAACGSTAATAIPTARNPKLVISVGALPTPFIASGAGSIWVPVGGEGVVARVDPASGRVLARIKVGDPAKLPSAARIAHDVPESVAVGFGSVWAATGDTESVVRIDPATDRITARIPVGVVPYVLAAGEGAVWLTSLDDTAVVRIDPASNTARTVLTSVAAGMVAAAFGSVWVTSGLFDRVLRLDPTDGHKLGEVTVSGAPELIAAGSGTLWVAAQSGASSGVVEIDPGTASVLRRIPVALATFGVAVGEGAVWAAGEGGLYRVNPTTGAVKRVLAGSRLGVLAAEGYVWSIGFDGKLTRVLPGNSS